MRVAVPYLLGISILACVAGLLGTRAAGTTHWPKNSTGTSPGSPVAVIEKTVWNFGQVPIGEELSATFAIKNQGSKRLILSEQGQCCGSASQDVIIPPGETKELTFVIVTKHRRQGKDRKLVCYGTNDPLSPSLAFRMEFELMPDSSH